ncbi:CDP-diacylglycerol--inositol 3-phosphatidyltransferase [Camarhynchus parvulus]|uniref:CDP-diacylglycerol--inositol 3-phosphatidyltransferase n=1 Tax=Geospiza parvula TaxID=87175 RepID=UPI00123834FB|nr:CDP-diacylglycerol--inositol 3-phosphatidyltransferase [Camarhynchus parvulus]
MGGDVRSVFLFVPNLIGYARILLAAVSFWLMPTRPGPAAACYGLAGLLDAVDGHTARALGQGSRLGAMLDMLTDRLSSLCLLLNLALLYPQWAGLFQLSMALDVASHWLHMHWWAGPRGQSRPLLFLLCAGNEGFHCCLYLLYWGEGPRAFPAGPGLFRLLLWLSAPLAALKSFLNLLQLGGALRGVAALDAAERARKGS